MEKTIWLYKEVEDPDMVAMGRLGWEAWHRESYGKSIPAENNPLMGQKYETKIVTVTKVYFKKQVAVKS